MEVEYCPQCFPENPATSVSHANRSGWNVYNVCKTAMSTNDMQTLQQWLPSSNCYNCDFGTWPPQKQLLHWGAQSGSVAAMQYLLSLGVDINAQDARGQTALHHAAYYGQAQAVQTLLAAGANPTVTNKAGETPYAAGIVGGKLDQATLQLIRVDQPQS